MKRKSLATIIICIISVMILAGCGTAAESNSADKPEAVEEDAEIAEDSEDEAEDSDDEDDQKAHEKKSKKKASEMAEESGEPAALTEAECEAEVEKLIETEPVTPDNAKLLFEMANCVTFARILNNEGVIFSGMDNRDKASLRHHILDSVLWLNGDIHEDMSVTVDNEAAVLLEDAEELFEDFYGERDFSPYEYERVENGYLYPLLADGEAWQKVAHMQYFEDDDYILFSGPGFYESNGWDEEYLGYADILFAKNPDSRYGVTLAYGRYRDRQVDVAYAEASSELADSGAKKYAAGNLIDGDYTTIWAEGAPGTGIGETITLYLDKEQYVYGVLICNGYTASYDQYRNNGLITRAEADFGGGNYASAEFESNGYDGATAEILAESNRTKIELESPALTDTIVITITDATSGAKYDDTCVSEIVVY